MRAFLRKSGILVWVIAAIILATILGSIRVGGNHLVPVEIGRIFATFSAIFSQFLSFSIPLIIIGLVTPAIADLGRGAGKWLGITTAIAYGSTLFSGFLTFLVCASLFPRLLASTQLASVAEPGSALDSYFTIEMPAPRPRSAIAGVTRPMMISGIEKDRNWLKIAEKVAKIRPISTGIRWSPPIRTDPRTVARMIAAITHTRIPDLRRNARMSFTLKLGMMGRS